MEVLTPEVSLNNYISPVIQPWPLMGSPAPLILIFTVYLWFVLNIGPRYMQTQKPMSLTTFTRIYNILQVIICTYFVSTSAKYHFDIRDTWSCLPLETDKELFLQYKAQQWWFLLLRLAELVETVVFVLRKKQNQVSTLHVYHHISTAVIVWMCIKYNASYMDQHPAWINSVVHIIMYSYYFMSSFKQLNSLTNVVKPFITMIQLIQLVIIVGHTTIAVLPSCAASKIFYVHIVNAGILIFFFAQFYVRSYVKKKTK